MKYLQSITGTTNGLEKEIKIPLNGRNLIITGQNGVGKTFFLNQVNNTITKELLSKIALISEESFRAKNNFIIRLENMLIQNPQLNFIFESENYKKIKNLSKSKSSFNVKDNNQFYTTSRNILDEIYYLNKSNITHKNRYLNNKESNNLYLDSKNNIDFFLNNYYMESSLEKKHQ